MNDLLVRIRPVLPADSALAVSLIHLSMGSEVDWLFGQETEHSAEAVVAAFPFSSPEMAHGSGIYRMVKQLRRPTIND